MHNLLIAIVISIFAVIGNGLGSLLVPKKLLHRSIVNISMAIGSGCMIGVVILEMVPESLRLTEKAPLFLGIGFMVAHFFEHIIAPHFHFGEETHEEEMITPTITMSAIFGMGIHSLFDGVSIGSGFVVSMNLGLLVFIAILLHKMPEGFTISTMVVCSGRPKKNAIIIANIIGLLTLFGVILAFVFKGFIFFALPFSAGITLYVAASDLIPILNELKGIKYSILIFLGFLIIFVLHLIAHEIIE
jgi:ZIP family zinc transporter/zinc and cadmium transporter